MALELIWSQEALEDIESIASYIQKDSSIYAKSVVSKIFEKVEILADFPEIGRVVPEISQKEIRELFVYSYRLVYRINTKNIIIIAVIHGRRII